ncbi:phage tail sheath family protein [Thermaerobacillus caldiproteolyticus]|uniref:phage tail sheath family protein n=1 Tax=Thermaerobacillus caldiproteolyticus TaxID=247480 RepID=UPI00188CC15D|nr:phage tail sheath family protein [Anoxybacillus caldiproteolyticus]QPA33432.1 phage tail sheath family protein [Anoxybacillus caldiproteolyticus]
MTYQHGVSTTEISTSVPNTPQDSSASKVTVGSVPMVNVAVGTAPIHLVGNGPVNKPILVKSFDEAKKKLGYSENFSEFTLCEAMNTHLKLYEVSPIVLINVLDPEKHKTDVTDQSISVQNKKAAIDQEGVLLDTLDVKTSPGGTTLEKDVDYTAVYDENGKVVISAIEGGAITDTTTSLVVSYSHLDSSKVTDADIIGGYDIETGKSTGLELINSVFPTFRMVPSTLIAPKFSKKPAIASVMKAKVKNINGVFKAEAYIDIDTTVANVYTKAVEYKTDNYLSDEYATLFWGDVKLGDKIYHLSSHAAALTAQTDSQNDDIPFVSPSNKSLVMDALIANGQEVALGQDQAAFLNANGIVTALNFIGGWKLWGNRTSAFPDNTDVKDAFIPIRRMFNWVGNNLIVSFWHNVDDPNNGRLIDQFIDGSNVWMNGLAARGATLGGRVKFLPEENPTTDLLNGKVRLHLYMAPPPPAEDIDVLVEFDVSYLSVLTA